MESDELEYVGFWARVGASVIDTILIGIIIWPLLTAVYGTAYWTDEGLVKGPMDFLLSWVLPMFAVLIFWVAKQATPGKMAISAKIVDARTGETPSTGQFIGRYLAYFRFIAHYRGTLRESSGRSSPDRDSHRPAA